MELKDWKDVLKKGAAVLEEATQAVGQATMKTLQKTKEFADENRLTPGSKEKYIDQLECELEAKERELRTLKKQIKRKNWGRKKGW